MFMMSCTSLLGTRLFIVCLVVSLYTTSMMIASGLSSTKVGLTKCFYLLIVETQKTLK